MNTIVESPIVTGLDVLGVLNEIGPSKTIEQIRHDIASVKKVRAKTIPVDSIRQALAQINNPSLLEVDGQGAYRIHMLK
jgi:hypothetical protein